MTDYQESALRDANQELLTPDQLAAYLDIPPKTIYEWRSRGGGPPGIRVGRHLRFRMADVQAWLTERTTARA